MSGSTGSTASSPSLVEQRPQGFNCANAPRARRDKLAPVVPMKCGITNMCCDTIIIPQVAVGVGAFPRPSAKDDCNSGDDLVSHSACTFGDWRMATNLSGKDTGAVCCVHSVVAISQRGPAFVCTRHGVEERHLSVHHGHFSLADPKDPRSQKLSMNAPQELNDVASTMRIQILPPRGQFEHSLTVTGRFEWCSRCGRTSATSHAARMQQWRRPCVPLPSFHRKLARGHLLAFDGHWRCTVCPCPALRLTSKKCRGPSSLTTDRPSLVSAPGAPQPPGLPPSGSAAVKRQLSLRDFFRSAPPGHRPKLGSPSRVGVG